jgi:hemerythrin-like domain-containing protein
MCDYCGCQEVRAIAELTAEHDAIVTLSGQAKRALHDGVLDLAAERAGEIAAVLAPHTLVEEGGLFPAMAAEYGDHVRALRDEHRSIEEVLETCAEGAPTDPAWPGHLERALVQLREHIIKEQDGLFPAALATLGPDQWDEIDAVRERITLDRFRYVASSLRSVSEPSGRATGDHAQQFAVHDPLAA